MAVPVLKRPVSEKAKGLIGPDGGANDPYVFTSVVPTFTVTSAGPTGNGFGVDEIGATFDIRLIAAVPEPSSLAILGMGSVALLARRRR